MRATLRTIGVLLLVCGPAAAATYNEDVAVSAGGELRIDLEAGGTIDIEGWDEDRLVVEAEVRGRDADNVSFDLRRDGDSVEILMDLREQTRRQSTSIRLLVRVPHRFDLRVVSAGGGVRIDGVEGRIAGETGGGRLKLSHLGGELSITTGGGNVELVDSEVDGSVETAGGNIVLRNVVGSVEAGTMGGNVIYDNVRPGPTSERREVKISTFGGNIEAPDAPHGAVLETLGGNITIGSAGRYVDAETLGGNITIREVDGWVKATTLGGDIEMTMVGDPRDGRRDVSLSSLGGSITLTLPADLSMEIDVTLAYTKKSHQEYKIESDFPIRIERSDGWDYGSSPPQKHVTGSGTVGDGEHRIKIETINGDVRILRGR
jgi:DUF4097 and DUF4098 domain-containing protein YvlB